MKVFLFVLRNQVTFNDVLQAIQDQDLSKIYSCRLTENSRLTQG